MVATSDDVTSTSLRSLALVLLSSIDDLAFCFDLTSVHSCGTALLLLLLLLLGMLLVVAIDAYDGVDLGAVAVGAVAIAVAIGTLASALAFVSI